MTGNNVLSLLMKIFASSALAVLIGLLIIDRSQAAEIIRSMGYGCTAPLSQGNGTTKLTIGGSAEFESDLPLNIGIGDCLVYDTGSDGVMDAVAFIVVRMNARNYEVCDAFGEDPQGTVPTGTTNWRIHRAYISLADAANGLENPGLSDFAGHNFDNWSSNHNISSPATGGWTIACYAGAPNTNTANFSGWITNQFNYLKIITPYITTGINAQVGVSQRHQGAWDSNAFHMEVGSADGLNIPLFTEITGLQFKSNSTGTEANAVKGSFPSTVANIAISKCVFRGPGTSPDVVRGISIESSVSGKARIWNNVFYDYHSSTEVSTSVYIQSVNNFFTLYAYNNTIVNCQYGMYFTNANIHLKNCMAIDCSMGSFSGDATYADSTNNLTNAFGPALGVNPKSGKPIFANESAKDFHLSASDTIACNQGADLSADLEININDDIDGDSRSFAAYDIGVDELPQPPTHTPTITPTITVTATISATYTITPISTATPTSTITPEFAGNQAVGNKVINRAYPNPVRGKTVTFACLADGDGKITIRVYTVSAREIWQTQFKGVPNQVNEIQWNISNVPPGVYLYQIEAGNQKSSFKKLAICK